MRSRNFTRDEAVKKHRIMWNWIAQTCIQEQRKVMDYEAYYHFEWYDICGVDPLCNYNIDDSSCDNCPMIWPDGVCISYEIKNKKTFKITGLIHLYQSAKDYVEAARIAYQIADLPERRTHDQ